MSSSIDDTSLRLASTPFRVSEFLKKNFLKIAQQTIGREITFAGISAKMTQKQLSKIQMAPSDMELVITAKTHGPTRGTEPRPKWFVKPDERKALSWVSDGNTRFFSRGHFVTGADVVWVINTAIKRGTAKFRAQLKKKLKPFWRKTELVETDVKIKVRLELDSGDSQKIKNQAQAIKDTGKSPTNPSIESEDGFRGGIFGGIEDPGVKGFEKRQSVSGGVSGQTDKRSKTAFNRTLEFEKFKQDQEAIKQELERQKQQEGEIRQLISNPTGFVTDKIFDFFRNLSPFTTAAFSFIPFIAAAIAAPQVTQALINFLKDRRVIGVFRREILNEANPFLSRKQQRDRSLGVDAVRLDQNSGFTNSGGNLSSNTLAHVRANGISDIGLRDRASGLF